MKEIGNEEMQDLRGETPEVRLIGEGGGEVNVKEFSLGETARRIIESLPKFGKVSTSREN